MKNKFSLTLLFVFSISFLSIKTFAQESQKERLVKHVYFLADDSLLGRDATSIQNKIASDYIRTKFEEIGLKTKTQVFGDDANEYNIIGMLEGNDQELSNEMIVIGAHFDHIGFKIEGEDTIVFNGADDNASGTAAMIEIARKLYSQKDKLKRTFVFVAFDAEETGLNGSSYFISDFLEKDSSNYIKFMIDLDMVGYLKQSNKLNVVGVRMLKDYEEYFDKVKLQGGYNLSLVDFDKSFMGDSDHSPFAKRNIPSVLIQTGLSSPYHKPEDDADKIDYDGLSLVVDYVYDLSLVLANEKELDYSGKSSFKHKGAGDNQFGLNFAIGSSNHYFYEGSMTGKTAMAYLAGFYARRNLGDKYALKAEINYEHKLAYRQEGQFIDNSISIPLSFLFRMSLMDEILDISFGLGPYYNYNFGGSLASKALDYKIYNQHEAGFQFGFDYRIYKIIIGYQSKIGLSDVMRNSPDGRTSSRTNLFKIGYLF